MKKYQRQIQQLIKMRLDCTDLPIYPDFIADWLNCPVKNVENELLKLSEEGIIREVYVMRCAECNEVIAISEWPFDLGGQVECPGCNCQMESASMNPVLTSYIRCEMEEIC